MSPESLWKNLYKTLSEIQTEDTHSIVLSYIFVL